MALLCNYTHPELQITDGLIRQKTGILFPYNPEFYDTVTGLYGPGALYCWYMLLASVLIHWFFCPVNNLKPDLSSDLLGALAYPAFAATDLIIQSVRMMGKDDRALAIYCLAFPDSPIWEPHSFSDTPLDMKDIPPDVLDSGQHVIDILGPYRISWTAGLFLYFLQFGLRKPGISSNGKLTSTRSPYPVMGAALCYIFLSLIVFYFSIADPGMACTLFFWDGSRQVMLIGTCTFAALLIMAIPLSVAQLVQAMRRGREVETRELLHNIMWTLLPGAVIVAVAVIAIFEFGKLLNNIPCYRIPDTLQILALNFPTFLHEVRPLPGTKLADTFPQMAPSISPNSDKTKKRPKVRGCYQCSRRRIDCDRQEPECAKCIIKGIKCSGLGLRYRFNDGIAARGKFVGKTFPVVDIPISTSSKQKQTTTAINKHQRDDPFRESGYEKIANSSVQVNEMAEDTTKVRPLTMSKQKLLSIHPGLDHVDPKSRFCLGYFSNHIAQLIAVINMGFNGYRDLVLPKAETDPLVRKAVLLVVEQHLSLQKGTSVSLDPAAYSSLVRELISRSHQCAPQNDDSALTALLLLHIREMISGSDNFRSEDRRTDLRTFLQLQILRVCLFGESLFNETNGVHFIQAQQRACLEFITWCDRFHPELKDLLSQLANLTTLACDIYVQRAVFNPPAEETVHMIEEFKQSLGEVDAYVDIVGRHLLAWPYFIVAAESSTADHRQFFLEKLVSLHNTTGCWNLLRAIDQVKEIWASQSSIRWTSLLGGPTQAFIM
ncbi:acriflavine sensitivity control acr-2 [Fusarium sporotrichioides]|uniref:Acriflavine sensitivity control acr-2 n=1 Tax=Fusarium sporotrichioides TaxID=5514 RepID=A0A395SFV4_FUSSP|nr:acriflavine sensitivity control acr-2 [Fusarium sporotrichioides]